MNLADFVSSTIPADRDPSESLRSYLDRIFTKYLNSVQALDGSVDPLLAEIHSQVENITTLCQSVRGSVEHFLSGDPTSAQNCFDSGLVPIEPYLNRRVECPASRERAGWLFRMRIFDDLQNKSRLDLFHIPFDKRHLVGPQRFSLQGIPCLYAGSTSYVCWEELGRPLLERTFTMGMKINQPIEVLSIAYNHDHIFGHLNSNSGKIIEIFKNSVVDYFVCFPLIFAVHIKALIPGAKFVEEYIIPQLLLRWVRKHPTCVGIRYMSTHVKSITPSHLASNFVFPTKSSEYEGHCKILASKFDFTDPIPWSLLSSASTTVTSAGSGLIYVTGSKPIDYCMSTFGRNDGAFICLPTESLILS